MALEGRELQLNHSESTSKLISEGKFDQAERSLKNLLSDNSHVEEKHTKLLELGRVLFWKGAPSEAKSNLELILEENPEDGWATSFLGQVEVRMGNYDRARSLFEKAISLNPSNHEAELFLHGDTLGQAQEARRMLTHGKLDPQGRIRFAELCQAIDFKRGKVVDFEKGEITQQAYDRMNIMLDFASVGQEVDSELTLRKQFNEADEIVYYAFNAFGDAILGLNAIHAIAKYFEIRPDKKKPVEIVTAYASPFQGLAELYDFIRVRQLGEEGRNSNEQDLINEDLQNRDKNIFVISNTGKEAIHPDNTLAVVNIHIDRFSRDLEPWRETTPPYRLNSAYPGKAFRFVEMMLGEKLTSSPALESNFLPLSERMEEIRRGLQERYNMDELNVHTVIESASTLAKKFSPDQLEGILLAMVKECQDEASQGGRSGRIFFVQDPGTPQSFSERIALFPPEVRRYISVFKGNLSEVAALTSLSESVLTPDTGIAHLSASLGAKTLILHTMADPYLWHAGGDNVDFLAADPALIAHENRTSVNMIQWGEQQPIVQEAFTVDEIFDRWKRLWKTQASIKTGERQTSATILGLLRQIAGRR